MCIFDALRRISTYPDSTEVDANSSLLETNNLFLCKETITTSKLSDQLVKNDGVYLNKILTYLMKLREFSRHWKARQERHWTEGCGCLSLNTGCPWTRSTTQSNRSVDATRLELQRYVLILLQVTFSLSYCEEG